MGESQEYLATERQRLSLSGKNDGVGEGNGVAKSLERNELLD